MKCLAGLGVERYVVAKISTSGQDPGNQQPAMTIFTATTVTVESVQDWKWDRHSPDHRAAVPMLTSDERRTFSLLMDTERPTQQQIALREALRRKISYRISKEIGW